MLGAAVVVPGDVELNPDKGKCNYLTTLQLTDI